MNVLELSIVQLLYKYLSSRYSHTITMNLLEVVYHLWEWYPITSIHKQLKIIWCINLLLYLSTLIGNRLHYKQSSGTKQIDIFYFEIKQYSNFFM